MARLEMRLERFELGHDPSDSSPTKATWIPDLDPIPFDARRTRVPYSRASESSRRRARLPHPACSVRGGFLCLVRRPAPQGQDRAGEERHLSPDDLANKLGSCSRAICFSAQESDHLRRWCDPSLASARDPRGDAPDPDRRHLRLVWALLHGRRVRRQHDGQHRAGWANRSPPRSALHTTTPWHLSLRGLAFFVGSMLSSPASSCFARPTSACLVEAALLAVVGFCPSTAQVAVMIGRWRLRASLGDYPFGGSAVSTVSCQHPGRVPADAPARPAVGPAKKRCRPSPTCRFARVHLDGSICVVPPWQARLRLASS